MNRIIQRSQKMDQSTASFSKKRVESNIIMKGQDRKQNYQEFDAFIIPSSQESRISPISQVMKFNDKDGNVCSSIEKQQDSDISVQGLSPFYLNEQQIKQSPYKQGISTLKQLKQNYIQPLSPFSQYKLNQYPHFSPKNLHQSNNHGFHPQKNLEQEHEKIRNPPQSNPICSNQAIRIQKLSQKQTLTKPCQNNKNNRFSTQKNLKQKILNGFQQSIENQKEYLENQLKKQFDNKQNIFIQQKKNTNNGGQISNFNNNYYNSNNNINLNKDSQNILYQQIYNQVQNTYNQQKNNIPLIHHFNNDQQLLKDKPQPFNFNTDSFLNDTSEIKNNSPQQSITKNNNNHDILKIQQQDDISKQCLKEIPIITEDIHKTLEKSYDTVQKQSYLKQQSQQQQQNTEIKQRISSKVKAFQILDDSSISCSPSPFYKQPILHSPSIQESIKVILFNNPQKYQSQENEEFIKQLSLQKDQKQIYYEQYEQTQESSSSGDEINNKKIQSNTTIIQQTPKQNYNNHNRINNNYHNLNNNSHITLESPNILNKGKIIDNTLTQKKDSTFFNSHLSTNNSQNLNQMSNHTQIASIQSTQCSDIQSNKTNNNQINKNHGLLLKKESNFGQQIKLIYEKQQEYSKSHLNLKVSTSISDFKKEILQLGCSSVSNLKFKEQQKKLMNLNSLYKKVSKNNH